MKPIQQDTNIRILGQSIQTQYSLESSPDTARIPGLWQEFMQNGGSAGIPAASSQVVYAVYNNYESDVTGLYTLTLGAASEADADNLNAAVIPAGRYLVFEADGPSPDCTIKAWNEIWSYFADGSSKYKRAYQTDFEMYTAASGVHVYISIAT